MRCRISEVIDLLLSKDEETERSMSMIENIAERQNVDFAAHTNFHEGQSYCFTVDCRDLIADSFLESLGIARCTQDEDFAANFKHVHSKNKEHSATRRSMSKSSQC